MAEILKLKSPAEFIGKQGSGVISFGSGQPDLPPPKEAFEGISSGMAFTTKSGKNSQPVFYVDA